MSEGSVWQKIGELTGEMKGVKDSIGDLKEQQIEVFTKLNKIHEAVQTPHECTEIERFKKVEAEAHGAAKAAVEIRSDVTPLLASVEENKRDWRRFLVDVSVMLAAGAIGWLASILIGTACR